MWFVRILAAAAPAFAVACSSGQLGERSPPEMSPGTVTLRLLLSPSQTYCDVIDGCSGLPHVFIATTPDTLPEVPMTATPPYQGPWCAPQCGDANECIVRDCGAPPAYATCISTGPVGQLVTSVEQTWNGSYTEWSSCGDGISCFDSHYVRPGRYFARMCVTPGTFTESDGTSRPTCTPTGPEQCVDVPFDLPGPSVIEVPLPPIEGD